MSSTKVWKISDNEAKMSAFCNGKRQVAVVHKGGVCLSKTKLNDLGDKGGGYKTLIIFGVTSTQ